MTTSEEIAARVLDLSEAELFGTPNTPFVARELPLLDEDDFHGIALVAPRRVSVKTQATLPVAIGLRSTGLRAYEVQREASTCLVAMDLDRREVRVGRPFLDLKLQEHPPAGLKRRPPPEGNTTLATIHRAEARQALDLPWQPARLRLVALSYDWMSGPADVALESDDPPAPGPARAPSPLPSGGGTTYLGARPVPAGADLPLLEAELTRDAASALVLSGAISFRADAAHAPDPSVAVTDGGIAQPVAAVVPVTLIFASADGPPGVLHLAVAVYGPARAPGDTVHAQFSLPLPFALAPGEHPVYACVEGRVLALRLRA